MGIARKRLEDSFEGDISKCKSMSQIRELAVKKPSVKESHLDSAKVTLTIPLLRG